MLCDPTGNRRLSPRPAGVKWATGCGRMGDQVIHRKYATGTGSKSNKLRICTWNIRGLRRAGKLQVVEKTTEKNAITGLAETHWRDNGHFISSNNNMIICSSNTQQSINGVAIIINKSIKEAVLGYETVSDRIVSVKLRAQPINLNVIQVYAPTSSSTQDEIETFYGDLIKTISKCPNRELLYVIGDFNAKVGNTRDDDHWSTVTGGYGLGETNERGEMLLEFCAENNLVISNTCFKHHPRRLYTWRSPDGRTKNQIDYIIVKRRWKSAVKDVKTYPGMDCGSDHNALIAEVSLKLRKPPKKTYSNNKWDLLTNNTYCERATAALTTITSEHTLNYTADELWTRMKNKLEETAEHLRRDKTSPNKPWISQPTWTLIQERQIVKAGGIRDNNDIGKYNRLTKDINKALNEDKNTYITSICLQIEKHKHQNEPKDLFKKVNVLTRSFSPKYLSIEDEQGNILTLKSDILNRWQQYCKTLMSTSEDQNGTQIEEPVEEMEPPILKCEVEAALRKLANGKSPGSDGIVAEMLRTTGDAGVLVLLEICEKIWTTCQWPSDWTKSIYIPLHKKGSKQQCANYRTISLISHGSKIMLNIIQERLKPFILPQIPPEQAGFVPGRGTRDQILNIRQMIEKLYEFNVPAIFCFLDYSKAFDSVDWNHLWKVLKEMAIPGHLIQLIKSLYTSNEAYVRVDGELSQPFQIKKGVRQGCVLSPLLFNIYGEWIIRKATEKWQGGITLAGKRISNLRYADDTTLLASSEEEMAELLQRVERFSEEAGLRLNRTKSFIMVVDRRKTIPRPFRTLQDIAEKENLIYLGVLISNKGSYEGEVKRRIGMAKTALSSLTKIWKDRHIGKHTKRLLVQSLIFPIASYGSESWTINAACRRRIESFEMTCYRRMMRIPWTARRTNISILKELGIKTNERLLPTIQRQILKFFGHLVRRDGIEKLVIQGKVDGKRERGRSPNRYIDQIKKLTNMPLGDLMHAAEDREEWRNVAKTTA